MLTFHILCFAGPAVKRAVQEGDVDSRPIASDPRIGIWPTAHRLPANIQRFHVEFSSPAESRFRPVQSRLLISHGRRRFDTLVGFSQELWTPCERRLTLSIKPGDVQRRAGDQSDPVEALVAGRAYRLEISTGGKIITKKFSVDPPIMRPLEEQGWHVTRSPIGTRHKLVVMFDRVIDHALVAEEVFLFGPGGDRLAAGLALTADGRKLLVAPPARWQEGEYRLMFSDRFEDVCGNRFGGDRPRAGEIRFHAAKQARRVVGG